MLQMTHKVKMGRWGATRVATACVALGLGAAMLSMANPVVPARSTQQVRV